MNKSIIAILAVIIVIGAGAYIFTKKDNPKASTSQIDSAAAKAAPTGTSPGKIDIKNFSFNSAAITVKKGASVTWANNDSMAHTVTSVSGSPDTFDSGSIASGKTYTHTFTTLGVYSYICSFHSSMKGTVTVTE